MNPNHGYLATERSVRLLPSLDLEPRSSPVPLHGPVGAVKHAPARNRAQPLISRSMLRRPVPDQTYASDGL